ncbi:YjbQ family protein [Halobellus sp. GM3]|uniref:YjbQ family protein n=1 Tax=Halobellus sp. GM3 TaxID=3458410 RepID=UPI00403D90D6
MRPHTTAGVVANEAESSLRSDIEGALERLVPSREGVRLRLDRRQRGRALWTSWSRGRERVSESYPEWLGRGRTHAVSLGHSTTSAAT